MSAAAPTQAAPKYPFRFRFFSLNNSNAQIVQAAKENKADADLWKATVAIDELKRLAHPVLALSHGGVHSYNVNAFRGRAGPRDTSLTAMFQIYAITSWKEKAKRDDGTERTVRRFKEHVVLEVISEIVERADVSNQDRWNQLMLAFRDFLEEYNMHGSIIDWMSHKDRGWWARYNEERKEPLKVDG